MVRNFMIMLLLSIIFLIGSCGKPPVLPNIQEGELAGTPITEVSPDAPAESNSEPVPEPNPEPMPEPAVERQKTYHMNAAYRIVPNEAEGNKKVVLLTFDDGPKDQDLIESILQTLDKHHAKAIFFVNGYRVKQNPELLKTIVDADQVIGNHSWDHIDLKKQSSEKIKEQITSVQQIVQELTGMKPQFFRPPYGSSNNDVKEIVKAEGMLFMTWSNGSLDWDMAKITEQERPGVLIQNVLNQLHSGSNILMHELPWTAKALDDLLTKLADKGYEFLDPMAIELEMR